MKRPAEAGCLAPALWFAEKADAGVVERGGPGGGLIGGTVGDNDDLEAVARIVRSKKILKASGDARLLVECFFAARFGLAWPGIMNSG